MKKGQIMAMAVMSIMTVACTDYDLNGQTDWKGDEPLELSASISETLPTRAEEELAEGTYYFSYVNSKQTSVKYETTKVSFEAGNSTPDLTWDQINTNNNITNKLFILDNVPYINTNGFTSSNNTNKLINLKEIKEGTDTESRYNAGPAPTVPGEGNDLLWDTVKVEKVSAAPLSPVHFDLEHRMSMLTFKLQSKDPEIYTLLKDIENVEVKLHRVITEPYQFNRLTGAITINSNTKPIDEKAAVKLDVAEYTSEEGAITESWIFPPQEFHSTGRPVLAITLTDTEKNQTRTFKGVLPESMLYEDSNELLEFLPGCHLTITVLLGSWDDLTVNFRPVLVKKWVTYSAKDINAKQVGVYTAEELTELVTAYNQYSSEDNLLALWKYGTYDDTSSTWTFYLWTNLTEVTETDNSLGFITGEGKPSFTFEANGYTINGKTVNTDGTLTDNSTTDGGE